MQCFSIGMAVILAGTVVLFLVNHDDYHFGWLLGLVRVLLILAFVLLGISVAPPALAATLTADRSRLKQISFKAFSICFLWVGAFFALGMAYPLSLQAMDDRVCSGTAKVNGKVLAVDTTMSKGGSVQWAIYEYAVGGSVYKSAVRNKSLGLQPGQSVHVSYTSFWPRHSKVRALP